MSNIYLQIAQFILSKRSYVRKDEESAVSLSVALERVAKEAEEQGYDRGYRAAVRDQIVVRRAG